MQAPASIHFSDGVLLPKAQEASYLRNNLNRTVNIRHEVVQRIQNVKSTWLKLHVFWKNSSAIRKWQLLLYDAVIRSRLLYGLNNLFNEVADLQAQCFPSSRIEEDVALSYCLCKPR